MLTLYQAMRRFDITAVHLAAATGVSQGTAHSWIRGKRKIHRNRLGALRELLALTVDEASEILIHNRQTYYRRKKTKTKTKGEKR